MTKQIQYITDERGRQVGVILDLEEYHRLTDQPIADPELLVGLSQAELQALAESQLAPTAQTRLDELLARHQDQSLSAEELAELDHLLEHVDHLNLLKTRARYTLQQQDSLAPAA